jgi:hypothetical protein
LPQAETGATPLGVRHHRKQGFYAPETCRVA